MQAADIRITRATRKYYFAKFDSGNDVTRAFCANSGSALYVQIST